MGTPRKSFILYTDSLSVFDMLDDAQAAKLMRAIRAYQSGEAEKLGELLSDPIIRLVFEPFRVQFERDREKYETRASRSRANGRSGGRPSSADGNTENNPVGSEKPSGFSENPENPAGFKKPSGLQKTQQVSENPVGLEKPSGFSGLQKNPVGLKKPDSVSDSDSVSVSDSVLVSSSPGGEDSSAVAPPTPVPPKKKPEIDYGWVREQWNTICTELPQVSALNDTRKDKIRKRVAEMGGWARAQPVIVSVFNKIKQSDFMHGSRSGWRCSFDWVFANQTNWQKTLEGNYDNDKSRAVAAAPRYDPRRGIDPGNPAEKDWDAPI